MKRLTDKEALEVLKNIGPKSLNIATKFVEKTVIYPVIIYYKAGIPTPEIRTFVRAGEYCSESQAVMAAALEKEYPELQKDYRAALKAQKLPVSLKGRENPLKATLLGV